MNIPKYCHNWLLLFLLPALLSACKIAISVPTGGRVVTESEVYTCSEGQTCEIEVVDTLFDETFIAEPDSDHVFVGWKARDRGLCGNRTTACRLFTSAFEGQPSLMAFLQSDDVFYLEPVFSSRNLKLSAELSHTGPQGSTVTGEIGLWMFKKKALSMDAIADWLDRTYARLENKDMLEPVNVLWLDFVSGRTSQARDRVSEFLDQSGFFTETFHSFPYFGYYRDASAGESWKKQWGPTLIPGVGASDRTWVDADWPRKNNHGRIFPSAAFPSQSGTTVYVTAGSFSRESKCEQDFCLLGEKGHDYISFNVARDRLEHSGQWIESAGLRLGNEYPPHTPLGFTTGDHNGIRVFALYPPIVKITQPPADNTELLLEEPLRLAGSVKNALGVDLPGYTLTWDSDRDGVLGEGPILTDLTLSAGTHLITLEARDSDGAAEFASIFITISDKRCADLSGRWRVEESVTLTSTINGDPDTIFQSGTDFVDIVQEDCAVRYIQEVPDPSGGVFRAAREGNIQGNKVSFSGIAAVVIEEASCSRNRFSASGTIDGDRIEATTILDIRCTAPGIVQTVTGNGTALFTRP